MRSAETCCDSLEAGVAKTDSTRATSPWRDAEARAGNDACPCPAASCAGADLAAELWFTRAYDQFEADTLCEDSEPGWF